MYVERLLWSNCWSWLPSLAFLVRCYFPRFKRLANQRAVQCKSNLRQLGLGVELYGNAHQGYLLAYWRQRHVLPGLNVTTDGYAARPCFA